MQADANERYITLKEAAAILGIPYWKLQRAAKQELINTYTFFNSRQYVLVSEIRQAMASQPRGGAK